MYGRRFASHGLAVAMVGLLAAVTAGDALATHNTTRLVKPPSGGSSSPKISADGRYVAFSTDLHFGVSDNNGTDDVYVYDLLTGTTTMVSLPTGTNGTGNNGDSYNGNISADGRYVTFESDSDNLALDDNNDVRNVYVRDMVAQTTTVVSRPTGADAMANDFYSVDPAISDDGRYIAFESSSDNLVGNDNNAPLNVYVHDRVDGATTLASLPTGSVGTDNDASSYNASISADGRYVAFQSESDNLAANDNDTLQNVYVRDMVEQTTALVSLPTGINGSDNGELSAEPNISADGRYVAFESGSNNLAANDSDDVLNVFLRDTVAETTELVSLPTGTNGTDNNKASRSASVSGDGRYVAFRSDSSNLAANDNDAYNNIYVRDLVANTTTLASMPTGTNGTANNGDSRDPDLTPDGRYVAFASYSDNLAADDIVGWDTFVRTLLPDFPRNLEAPVVSGSPAIGKSLTCSDGTWSDGTLSRMWRRDGQPIAGQTAASYLLVAADAGRSIECVVTATNSDGGTGATSNALTVPPAATAGPPTPTPTPTPKLAISLLTKRMTVKPGRRVSFRIEANMPGKATLKIRKGRKTVASIKATLKQAGRYTIRWNGRTGTSNSGSKANRRAKHSSPASTPPASRLAPPITPEQPSPDA